MIQFFRRFFQSKVGIAVTLAFLALIAFAFASADVSSSGTFGGVSGGDRVAVVGDEKISTLDLSRAATSAVDGIRQQDPTISMQAFVEQGGLDRVLDQVIERAAITEFAETYGLRAGDNLVNSEILSLPAFLGADGNFNQDAYQAALRQRGLTDAMVRDDLRAGMLSQQALLPATFGMATPDAFAKHYASLLKERRKGNIARFPSTAFLPSADPTDAQLQAYYDSNRGDYVRPERRIIRYLSFGDESLPERAAPTAEEIANRYQERGEQYAASEERTVTQMIVSTKQAADAIRSRVQSGGSLEAAAREAGLQTAELGPVSQSEYAAQSSAEVAAAVFAASQGAIAEPARSGLGFHVVRVDAIEKKSGKTLEQARAEISAALGEEKRQQALADLSANIEEQVDDGVAISDIANELRVEISTTEPVTADGALYDNPSQRVPALLGPVLETAFQMEESNPQLAVIVPGQTFMVFEVSRITQSAAAPLEEIKEQVAAGWKLSEGAKAAKTAVDRILKEVEDGTRLSASLSGEEASLPAVQSINLSREELAQANAQVPAPLALMFSMAKGTTKKLEGPRNAGWFIVQLDEIETGEIAVDDPLFAQTKAEIAGAMQQEFDEQLRNAILQEVGAERNETAIEAVRKQLTGVS